MSVAASLGGGATDLIDGMSIDLPCIESRLSTRKWLKPSSAMTFFSDRRVYIWCTCRFRLARARCPRSDITEATQL